MPKKAGVYSPDGSWKLVDRVGRDVGSLRYRAILDEIGHQARLRRRKAILRQRYRRWLSRYGPLMTQSLFQQAVSMHLKARAADFAGREAPFARKRERWEDDPTYAVEEAR